MKFCCRFYVSLPNIHEVNSVDRRLKESVLDAAVKWLNTNSVAKDNRTVSGYPPKQIGQLAMTYFQRTVSAGMSRFLSIHQEIENDEILALDFPFIQRRTGDRPVIEPGSQ